MNLYAFHLEIIKKKHGENSEEFNTQLKLYDNYITNIETKLELEKRLIENIKMKDDYCIFAKNKKEENFINKFKQILMIDGYYIKENKFCYFRK